MALPGDMTRYLQGGSSSGKGMFQDPSNFMPNARGPQPYDLSPIYEGLGKLRDAPSYQKTPYTASKFSIPEESFQNAYTQAVGTASKPALAQGTERMRQLSQGFEGGRLGGAANAELALKNAMQTGSDLQDIGKGIGSNMAATRLNLENQMQKDQADENFRAAGFNDQQAKYMSDDAMNRAKMFLEYGTQLPTLQGNLTANERGAYSNVLGGFQGLFGL